MLAGRSTARAATEAEAATIHIHSTNVLDELGDCHVSLKVEMPPKMYTEFKRNNPNTAFLPRKFEVGETCAQLGLAKASFDDDNSTVEIKKTYHGFARLVGEDLWEAQLGGNTSELKEVKTFKKGRSRIFHVIGNTGMGMADKVLEVTIPESAGEFKVSDDGHRISYRLKPPPDKVGTNPEVEVHLYPPQHIMSCSANSYGNEGLKMPIARFVCKNSGDQTL